MKTTDSVMREKRDIEKKFYEDLADNEWILDDPYSPDMVQMPFHELEKRVHALLSHSLAEARREERNKLQDYCTHQDDCILSYWSAGRPTKNGGYERKYGEKWYQSRPVDKTPKCTCGLSDLFTGDNPERKV